MRELILYTLAVAYLAVLVVFCLAVIAIAGIWLRYWYYKLFRKSLKRRQMELVDKFMEKNK
jgi:ferritin-like protein